MKKDDIEFFDIVNEKDEVIGKISEDMQNTIKPSQLRFINIIITNEDRKIVEVLTEEFFLIVMIFQ